MPKNGTTDKIARIWKNDRIRAFLCKKLSIGFEDLNIFNIFDLTKTDEK